MPQPRNSRAGPGRPAEPSVFLQSSPGPRVCREGLRGASPCARCPPPALVCFFFSLFLLSDVKLRTFSWSPHRFVICLILRRTNLSPRASINRLFLICCLGVGRLWPASWRVRPEGGAEHLRTSSSERLSLGGWRSLCFGVGPVIKVQTHAPFISHSINIYGPLGLRESLGWGLKIQKKVDEIKCLKYSESSRETLLIYWQEYYHYLEFIITVGLIIQYYFAKKYKIHFKSFAFFFFFAGRGSL